MLKIYPKTFIFLFVFILTISVPALASDEGLDEFDAEHKAREAHRLAASDMMYQNEEWKAIYYQNQTIIQLLKQIRDSLETIKSQGLVKNEVEK